MGGRQLALDEKRLVLGIEDSLLDGVPGKAPDDLERVPERDGEELLALACGAAKDGEAAVARCPEEPGAPVCCRYST